MAAILGSIGFGAILPGLMCAGGMLLCMRMMFRGSRNGADTDKSGVDATDTATEGQSARIAALEAEVARLRSNQDPSRQPHT